MENSNFFRSNIYIEFDYIDSIDTLLNSKTFIELNEYFYNRIFLEKSGLGDIRFHLGSLKNLFIYYEKILLSKNCIFNEEIKRSLLTYILSFNEYWRTLKKFLFINFEKSVLQSEAIYSSKKVMDSFFNDVYYSCGMKNNFHTFYKNNGFDSIVTFEKNRYEFNDCFDIENIKNMVTITPYMCNTFSNTRSGLFSETTKEISLDLIKNSNEWLSAGFKIGKLSAMVLINKLFINHLVGLSILFESIPDTLDKFDLFLLFGIDDCDLDGKIYSNVNTNTIFGSVHNNKKNDYFGYMKKMLLTMHNIYFIKNNQLPIHGAMVKVSLINGKDYNIIIIGDSGAGKSESLEAFRAISGNVLKDMTVIFDDMGVLINENSEIKAFGTEIGAFVRVDDLDSSYTLDRVNDAVFFNTNRINSRVVVPITTYENISRGENIDYIFYANNYEDTIKSISIFDDLEDAITVFEKGERIAKGTTSEMGKVQNYFANPFGPVQLQEETSLVLNKFFRTLSKSGTVFGEIYTKLAIEGYQVEGPRKAANELLELLLKK